jgi:hypothetical protein
VCASCAIGAPRSLGRVELTFRIDEALEPALEAAVCRPDEPFRVVARPRR